MAGQLRVDVLGAVSVANGDRAVSGQALGGRRARVALVALALSGQPIPSERLASIVWADEPPATWQAALRGVIRGLRSACGTVGGGEQQVVATAPAGYQLAAGVEVDVDRAADDLRRAGDLVEQGRHRAAITMLESVVRLSGSQLLDGEDAEWLDRHRAAIDGVALRAMELLVEAAGVAGEHDRAIAAARQAVAAEPLEERAHRALIAGLDRSGDRAGAVRAFEQCRALLGDHLGVDPSSATIEVYLAALRDQAGGSAGRLPTIGSTFIGRDEELVALSDAISRPGLVTVAGRGGVGKSRLAIRVAESRHDFAGGRRWVSLASVRQNALVAATVALELGVPVGADDPGSALSDYLAPLGRLLLILDGCEGLIDGVASFVVELLAACPHLTLVVTSRVPLAVDAERIVAVEPLQSPEEDQGDTFLANVQVRLLLDRVHAGGGELTIDDRLAPHVAKLVDRCGGLPLAVELVAAQLAAISVGDLLDHLPDVVDDDRLRSVAQSSYALLDADEAAVFRRLAVLDGAVSLPLVRQVVAGGPIEAVRVVRILRELTARGLLSVDRSGPRWRYQQEDDLHRYARELLVDAGEESSSFARLCDAIRAELPSDARASPSTFQDAITDLLGSLRSLFAAGLDGDADADVCLELAFRLHRYFAATNVAEGRFWLARLLDIDTDSAWTPHARYALGYLSYWSGDTLEAVAQLNAAVDLFEGVEDSYAARALVYLAGLLDDLDRGAEAVECVRRAIDAAAPFGVDLQVSAAMGMGSILAERGDPSAATYADEAIDLCRQGGSVEQLALAMPTAAMVCWQVGAYEQCRAYVAEAQPMHADVRRIARVVLLSAAAGLAFADGDLDAAVDFGTQADLEATTLGIEREVPLIRAVLARALLAQGNVRAAAECAIGALDVAESMEIAAPLAICFETAALVGSATTAADDAKIAGLLLAADALRAQGARPSFAALAPAVAVLRDGLPASGVIDRTSAAALARDLLLASAASA